VVRAGKGLSVLAGRATGALVGVEEVLWVWGLAVLVVVSGAVSRARVGTSWQALVGMGAMVLWLSLVIVVVMMAGRIGWATLEAMATIPCLAQPWGALGVFLQWHRQSVVTEGWVGLARAMVLMQSAAWAWAWAQ